MIIYGDAELNYISSKNAVMKGLVEKYGYIERGYVTDVFESLVLHIIGQMLSNRVAKKISARFIILVGSITPENILLAGTERIKECGISRRKTEYIYDLANKVNNGSYDFKNMEKMTDEQVIDYLMRINGVGLWTAEMVTEFTLGRLNIFSYRDAALRNGIIKAHGLNSLNEAMFEELRLEYSPYASVASLYYYAINDDKFS